MLVTLSLKSILMKCCRQHCVIWQLHDETRHSNNTGAISSSNVKSLHSLTRVVNELLASSWVQVSDRKYCRPSGWLSQLRVVGTGYWVLVAHKSWQRLTSLLCKYEPQLTIQQFIITITSLLREITCHMGSHSVTCHTAAVTFPPLPLPKLVLDLATPERCKADLTGHNNVLYKFTYYLLTYLQPYSVQKSQFYSRFELSLPALFSLTRYTTDGRSDSCSNDDSYLSLAHLDMCCKMFKVVPSIKFPWLILFIFFSSIWLVSENTGKLQTKPKLNLVYIKCAKIILQVVPWLLSTIVHDYTFTYILTHLVDFG